MSQLTPRERDDLELMATGSSNQGIADALVIMLRAVEKYVSSIFGKLGLPSTRPKPAACSRCSCTWGPENTRKPAVNRRVFRLPAAIVRSEAGWHPT